MLRFRIGAITAPTPSRVGYRVVANQCGGHVWVSERHLLLACCVFRRICPRFESTPLPADRRLAALLPLQTTPTSAHRSASRRCARHRRARRQRRRRHCCRRHCRRRHCRRRSDNAPALPRTLRCRPRVCRMPPPLHLREIPRNHRFCRHPTRRLRTLTCIPVFAQQSGVFSYVCVRKRLPGPRLLF